jgi:hypothetical protein
MSYSNIHGEITYDGDGDDFGYSVAISKDGTRFAAGQNRNLAKGYVAFGTVSTGVLDASYNSDVIFERLGSAIALNSDGSKFIAGSDSDSAGTATYIGTVDYGANTVTIDVSIQCPDTTSDYGHSVAMDSTGNYCAVGAPVGGAAGDGAVYIYNVTDPENVISLQYDAPIVTGRFGDRRKLDMSDDGRKLLVCSSTNAFILDVSYRATDISITNLIHVTDGSGVSGVDEFGSAARISNDGTKYVVTDTAVQTNTGIVFVGDTADGVMDASYIYPVSEQQFGLDVDINQNGTKVIASADINNELVVLNVGASSLTFDSSYSEIEGGSEFGDSIAMSGSGNVIIVGAPKYDSPGNTDVGAVYVFQIPDADADGVTDSADVFGFQNLSVVPTVVTGLRNVFALAPGAQHTVALTRTGQVLTFGRNTSGQLGRATADVSDSVPTGASGVASGYGDAALLLEDGTYRNADAYRERDETEALRRVARAFDSALGGTTGYNSAVAQKFLRTIMRR